jgi:dipeptidyl aminopeptidase/acylaminoacyl peptidase
MRFSTIVLVLAGALALAGAAHAMPGTATLVFASDRADGVRELYVVRRDGTGQRRLTFNDLLERQPVWSPDGRQIAFAGLKDGNWDIYTVDRTGAGLRRLTSDPARDDYPKWTSDGWLVFQRGPFLCPCEAWIMAADGTREQRIDTGPGNAITPEPSPHGQLLAFASDRDGPSSLYTMPLNGGAVRRLTEAPGPAFGDFNPRWSPRGNEIAFLRDHDGSDNDLFVVRANDRNVRRLTATPERVEFWPSWSPDGSEVAFTVGFGPQRLRTISLADGQENAVSTWPSAPLVESFDDGIRDASLWHQIVDPGATLAEANGRLELSIAADAVPGGPFNQVTAHYGSHCSLTGDFDLQVDYELLQWPSPGVFAGLHAFFAFAGVSRISSIGGDDYSAWSGSAFASRPTADRAGSMRLVRGGGVLSAFYRGGDGLWQPLLAAPADPTASVYGAGLTAQGAWFTHTPAAVAFDDLRLNSGSLSCPEWWSDFAADVTATSDAED